MDQCSSSEADSHSSDQVIPHFYKSRNSQDSITLDSELSQINPAHTSTYLISILILYCYLSSGILYPMIDYSIPVHLYERTYTIISLRKEKF